MKLTSENVEQIFIDCLLSDGEDQDLSVIVEGVGSTYRFDETKLESRKEDIISMLSELPKEFHKNSGGGWSFLQACMDKDNNQWTGLHLQQDRLFCLGMAIGRVKYTMPREMWTILPGAVPYLTILEDDETVDEDVKDAEEALKEPGGQPWREVKKGLEEIPLEDRSFIILTDIKDSRKVHVDPREVYSLQDFRKPTGQIYTEVRLINGDKIYVVEPRLEIRDLIESLVGNSTGSNA